MKKKILWAILALVVVVPPFLYVQTTYRWARNSIGRAELQVNGLGDRIRRGDSLESIREAYGLTELQVMLASKHTFWVSRGEIAALEARLEDYRGQIENLGQKQGEPEAGPWTSPAIDSSLP